MQSNLSIKYCIISGLILQVLNNGVRCSQSQWTVICCLPFQSRWKYPA